MSDGTFTQADVDAAVAKAISDSTSVLQKRVEELEAQAQTTEVGKAIADAVAAKDTEIAELLSKLDASEKSTADLTAAKEAAETALVDFKAQIDKEKEDAETEAALAKLRADRLAEVKAFEIFEDEELEPKGDRFAAMSDEDWVSQIDEYKVLAEKVKTKGTPPPATGAFKGARSEGSDGQSALASISDLRRTRAARA